MLYSILVSLDVFIAAGLIGLILMQQGKGAGMGAAFGAGASGTVFGARGSGSFMTKMTSILAILFFLNSIFLAYIASNRTDAQSVVDTMPVVEEIVSTENNADIPKVINLPEGASQEEMIDIIKQEIDEKRGQTSTPNDIPAVN